MRGECDDDLQLKMQVLQRVKILESAIKGFKILSLP